MRRLLKRLATLAVGLLALGGSRAAVAQPKPVPGSNATISASSFTVRSAPGEVQGEDESAACPPGQNATGGGIGTTGPAPTGPALQRPLSGPLDAAGLTAGTHDGDDARHWYAADRATIA